MKAKHNITKPKKAEPPKQNVNQLAREYVNEVKKKRKPKPTFPDHPLVCVDIDDLPAITQNEITSYLNAAFHYDIA